LRAVLRERNVLLYFAGGIVSQLGDWALLLALPFYVYGKTGSIVSTGGIVAAELVPRLLLSSVAGVLADRWDRRLTMIGIDLFRACLVLAILIPAAGGPVWLVYVVAVAQASSAQLFVSAEGALLPTIIADKERLLAANSLLSAGTSIVRLVGPPLGGLLYVSLGLVTSAVADSASFALSALAILAIRPLARTDIEAEESGAERTAMAETGRRTFLRELADGARLLFTSRVFQVLCVTLSVVMIAQGMLETLFVPFARDVVHLNAVSYGGLSAAQGLGSLLGALSLAGIGKYLTGGRVAVGGALLAAGLCMLGFALARAFLLNAIFMLLLSVPVVIATVWVQTYYQQNVENRLLGRVLGLTENVSAAGVLAGVVTASLLGDRLGPAAMVVVASGILVTAGLIAVVGLRGTSTRMTEAAPLGGGEMPAPGD
jgi:MFS family permease